MSWLIEPLSFEFMRNAFATAFLLGILCPVVGSYLIVQKMGLLGDVISHAVLPGLAIAYYLNIDIFIGAFISGTLSTLIITLIQSQTKVKVDVAMALVFSGALALGIVLITLLKSKIDLLAFLFGDILGVTGNDVKRTLIITLAILLAVRLFYKELLLYTFNPLGAKAMALPVNFLQIGLVSVITITVIATMQAVGVVLVISLLVGPAITAYLLVKELHQMMALGAVFGVLSSISGMYISYYFNVPSGPSIVLVVCSLFFLTMLFSPSQGILTRPDTVNKVVNLFKKS